MRVKFYCWSGLGLYAVLSVADLILTFLLLSANLTAYESNPFAGAYLERYGWEGLVVFKAMAVFVVVASVLLLLRRRPILSAVVVTFGCAVLLSVNAYSHDLLRQANRSIAQGSDVPWHLRHPARPLPKAPPRARGWAATRGGWEAGDATPVAGRLPRPDTPIEQHGPE